MISFDRRAGNVDLTPLWNEINSIESNTSSIWNFVSTLSGGGGGGNYYLNISDVLSSSLKYVYNLTGDITAIPTYDSFTFHGNIGNFNSLSVDSSIKNFEIGDVDLISSLTISTNVGGNGYSSIKLFGKTLASDILKVISNCQLNFESINACSLHNMNYLSINAVNIHSNYISSNLNTIFVKSLSSNTFSNDFGYLNCFRIIKNSFINYSMSIDAEDVSSNSFNYVYVKEFNINSDIIYNSFYFGINTQQLTPNFKCVNFKNNVLNNIVNNFTIEAKICRDNQFSNPITGIFKSNNIEIDCITFYYNSFSYINNLLVKCQGLGGRCDFSEINSIKFYADSITWNDRMNNGGPNTYFHVNCLDVHEITTSFSIYFVPDNYIGIGTMKLNYNCNWTPYPPGITLYVQPSNIYTLDFYNCENYIGGSTFTIPSFYSGYDEGNVWISGKPLSELGYTLSVSA